MPVDRAHHYPVDELIEGADRQLTVREGVQPAEGDDNDDASGYCHEVGQ